MSTSEIFKKLKPYCNKSSEQSIDELPKMIRRHFQNERLGTNTTDGSACVFDISKTINGETLCESLGNMFKTIDEIEKVTKEISENEFSATYTQTYYVDKLEREYQDLANKAFFSPARKLIKLKSTPEYQQKLREAKAADAHDTKNNQQKAKEKLKKLRDKLADLLEEKTFYQPLYNRCIYWAQEAWRDLFEDVKEEYGSFSVGHICNHIIAFGLDRNGEGTTDKLLGDAKYKFVYKLNYRSI